jgi:hypothetical protein
VEAAATIARKGAYVRMGCAAMRKETPTPNQAFRIDSLCSYLKASHQYYLMGLTWQLFIFLFVGLCTWLFIH